MYNCDMATIRINTKNLYHNLNQLSLKTGDKNKIAVVLKDNAYGHGIELMAELTSTYGITQAVVVTLQEAQMAKKQFDNILILNDTPIVAQNFSFAITSIEALKQAPQKTKIELKVDTGMHRNGINMSEIPQAIKIIKQKKLNLFGLFTHFKNADELSSELFWQRKNFEIVKETFLKEGFTPRVHSNNSAGLLRDNNFSDDIARVGIALYGYSELPAIYDSIELKPVMSLWADKICSRELKKGQKVGYGGDFVAPEDMTVSTYDVGYGDGLFRGNSKNPLVTKEGLPILGRVSMDAISLESTKDEICIFDDAKKVAKHFDTISYEILTNFKANIKRVAYNQDMPILTTTAKKRFRLTINYA